jgi:hypothetical protein
MQDLTLAMLVDVDSAISGEALAALRAIAGVLAVRDLPG